VTQEERIARNNAQFREANEVIRAKADQEHVAMATIPFLCECPREDCRDLAPMSLDDYANVRSHPAHFINAPGHEGAEGPDSVVVQRADSYVVVEKGGPMRDIVTEDWAARRT
jgi:hypothetical protein